MAWEPETLADRVVTKVILFPPGAAHLNPGWMEGDGVQFPMSNGPLLGLGWI